MATAQAPILETARREVSTLQSEINALKIKEATEQSDLAALETERTELAEKIALGEAPASKASAIARRIEESETRLRGFRSIITRKGAELDARYPELRRMEAETTLAARRAEAETLRSDAEKVCRRINGKLLTIIQADFPELDGLRDRLRTEFHDIVPGADTELCRMLTGEDGKLAVEASLTPSPWREQHPGDPPFWPLRGDIQLQVRNLRKPKQ